MTREERYMNLAMINIGEAIAEISNVRQRGVVGEVGDEGYGKEFGAAQIALDRAKAALNGKAYAPPPDQKDA